MRILRGLTSRLLACGCLAGIYETYDGLVVTLLDDRHISCADPSHVVGEPLREFAGMTVTEITDRADRPRSS